MIIIDELVHYIYIQSIRPHSDPQDCVAARILVLFVARLHHRLAHFIFINALLDHALKNALLDHNCKWFKDIEMIYKLNGNSTLNESK